MSSGYTWLKVGRLIDGSGRQPREHVGILINEGRIESVSEDWKLDPGYRGEPVKVIEADDCTAVPGLIDPHVHLVFSGDEHPVETLMGESDSQLLVRAASNAQRALAAGITTLRDCGDRANVTVVLRDAIRRGYFPGPRLVVAGQPITTTGGHLWFMGIQADSEVDLKMAVRGQAKAGVDFIKLIGTGGGMTPRSNMYRSQYTEAEMRTVTAEAHRLELRVAAHLHATEGIRFAVKAGVDTLEHCSWLNKESGFEYDGELAREIADHGLAVVTTIGSEREVLLRDDSGTRPEYQPQRFEILRIMWDSGITMGFGSDAGVANTVSDGIALTLEAAARRVGLPRLSLLRSATATAAKIMGLDGEIGTIEPGKRADLLLVQGDPLRSLTELIHPKMVFLDGVLVAREGSILVRP